MKINISPEDIFTFQQDKSFADGYVEGLSGKKPSPPRIGNFSAALHRLGQLCGEETRKIDQKDVKPCHSRLDHTHRDSWEVKWPW